MGLKERFLKATKSVTELLLRQREAQSFEEYLALLASNEISQVVAVPSVRDLMPTDDPQETRSKYEYYIEFHAFGLRGDTKYRHVCQEFEGPRLQSIYRAVQTGFNEIETTIYEDARDRTFLTAKVLNTQIEEKIPGAVVSIKGRDGVFTSDDYRELERRAKQNGIKPW